MRPKVKYAVIYRHRNEYPVSLMCSFFHVSRSGYYDFLKRLERPDKDAALAEIIRICQRTTDKTYGYRRVWLWLKHRKIHRNPKTILRVMKKYGLLSEIRRRRKWVNLRQQLHKYDNLLKRQFQADRPNTKWVTDISYIHTKEGVLYLSMIRDLYDNSIVAYKTASQAAVDHPISDSQIYFVLHRHGWRKVMPRSRHPKKADDETIEASKKLSPESKH